MTTYEYGPEDYLFFIKVQQLHQEAVLRFEPNRPPVVRGHSIQFYHCTSDCCETNILYKFSTYSVTIFKANIKSEFWNLSYRSCISDYVTKTFLSDSASSLTERLFALRLTFRVGNSKSFWRSFRKRFRVDVLPHEIRFCFLICFETLVREGELCVRQCSLERVSEVCLCFKLFGCDLLKV